MAGDIKKLGRFTVREFFGRFPDDDACLTHIMEVRYGLRHECRNCGVYSTFHKLAKRPAFSCAACGAHVYPCAGTIFQDSRTPLTVWFYAIYMFVTTRHGVSGKELERTLGVTYKTAWRMGQQIRKLMAKADGFEMMQGHVEADEAYIGGRRRVHQGRRNTHKTVVMGIVERGGRVAAMTVPNAKTDSPLQHSPECGARVKGLDRRMECLQLTHPRRVRTRCGLARQERICSWRTSYQQR
jgi:transposase